MFLLNFVIFLKTKFLHLIVYYHILLVYLIMFIIILKGVINYANFYSSKVVKLIMALFSFIILIYWNTNVPQVMVLFSFFCISMRKIWIILVYFTHG